MLKHLPLAHPEPDAKRLIDILMGQEDGSKPPLIEYLVDDLVRKPVVVDLLGREWVEGPENVDTREAYWDNTIEFWYRMGYDFVRIERSLNFEKKLLMVDDTAPGAEGARAWANEHTGSITTWQDFETYPWPSVEEMDLFPFEYINAHLPEGMGLIVSHAGGIYETLWGVMSYEGLCLAIHDAPDLVKAVSNRIGQLMVKVYENLLDLDRVVAIFPGDDMGFRTSTLISPDALRAYCLPWHERFAKMAHQKGLPYFLHSCGNVELIMEDLIENVGIDGKHSYEDAIVPIEEFQVEYGDRIAVLGGIDVDLLTSGSTNQVRERARFLLETCGGRGRFAIGSGSSIASYIPVDNYLAMLDETLDFSQ